MKKLCIIALFLGIVLQAYPQPRLWGELWSHHNYAYNNFSDQQQYLLNNTVLRGGARFFLSRDTFTLALDPYVETQLAIDGFNSRHENIYNQHVRAAAGFKLNFRHYDSDSYFQFLELDLYTEYRKIWNLAQNTNDQYSQISNYDLVGGIRIWSNSKPSTIGYELWGDLLSYRLTNFALKDEHNYLINTLSPVLLVRPFSSRIEKYRYELDHLQRLAIYLNPEITFDLLPETYNDNPYSNYFLTRIGFRWLCPIRYHQDSYGKKYINLLFYTDYTMVYWFNPIEEWNLPNEDFRAGVIIYLPWGDNKMIKWRI